MIPVRNVVKIGGYSYFPDEVLGRGTNGEVYKGVLHRDGTPIAVKVIKLSEVKTKVRKHLLACEIEALSKMNSKYVIRIFQVLKDQDYYFIPMQFCPNGTLRDYIKAKRKLSPTQALKMFQKILDGYAHILRSGFIHRDLKTQNILLTNSLDPVIIDFGYCEKAFTQNKKLTYNVGSPAYMSPEAYNDSYYCQKSDIWALGVILHEMLTGTIPKIDMRDVDKFFKDLTLEKYARIYPQIADNQCKDILYASLLVNVNKRANCQELLNIMKNQKKTQQFHHEKLVHYVRPNQSYDHGSKKVKTMKTQPSSYQNITSMASQKNLSLNSSFNGIQSKPYVPIHHATFRNTIQNNPQFGTLRKKLIAANSKMLNSQPIQTVVKKPPPNLFISQRFIASPPKLNHSLSTSAKIDRSTSQNLSIKQPPRI